MSGTAKMYDTTLKPTKQEIAQAWIGASEILGSYRLVDTVEGEVGIESLIAHEREGRLIQIPLSYRSAEISPEHTISTLEHGVLGKRWVTNALGDPVAVREYIRTILTGDDGASRDDGVASYLSVKGTGTFDAKSLGLGEVTLIEVGRQRVIGSVEIDGEGKYFKLRIPQVLQGFKHTGRGHSATHLRLVAQNPEKPEQELLIAEFNWVE